MKVIVFGATGTAGREVTRQAVEAGHQVTAFARQPERLDWRDEHLQLLPGDVLNPSDVTAAVTGHDAVIIMLGDGRRGQLRAAGTRNILNAMRSTGVKRVICMSTLGAGDSKPMLNWFWKYIMFGLLLRKAMADHQDQEDLVRAQGDDLDWIIVRPSAFADGPKTGQYHQGRLRSSMKLALKISRADLAQFILAQLGSNKYLRQAPGISY